MKLHLDKPKGINLITAFDSGAITINGERHTGNLLVGEQAIIAPWASGGFDALTAQELARALELAPQVLLLGTGSTQRFPEPALLRPLIDAGVGVEVMNLGAACRTFNILVTEGRAVVAALIADQPHA